MATVGTPSPRSTHTLSWAAAKVRTSDILYVKIGITIPNDEVQSRSKPDVKQKKGLNVEQKAIKSPSLIIRPNIRICQNGFFDLI